jgi:hypothetical protein
MSAKSKLQLTLAILKPDLVRMPYRLDQVRNMILQKNFFVIQSKVC